MHVDDEASAAAWTTALRHSHDRLHALVEPLDAEAPRALVCFRVVDRPGSFTPRVRCGDLQPPPPSESFLRLIYGRLDAAHTPPVEAPGVDLDELRAIYPGF